MVSPMVRAEMGCHRLLYHSTLGPRVIKKEKSAPSAGVDDREHPPRRLIRFRPRTSTLATVKLSRSNCYGLKPFKLNGFSDEAEVPYTYHLEGVVSVGD